MDTGGTTAHSTCLTAAPLPSTRDDQTHSQRDSLVVPIATAGGHCLEKR